MEALLNNPTFIWKCESFACVPNTLNDSKKSADVGFSEDIDFRMTVRLNQFTPNIYPEINDYITYNGTRLLITTIKKTPHNVYYVYICKLANV